MSNLRVCRKCENPLPSSEFNRRPAGKDGLSSRCRACTNDYARGRYSLNRIKAAERNWKYRMHNRASEKTRKARWYKRTRQQNLERMAAWRYRTRREAIKALGGKCTCCGERHFTMLDLDHVNNDGAKHRSEALGGNFKVYRQISNGETPQYKVQVLCCNCNQSKRRNGGACEHKSKR